MATGEVRGRSILPALIRSAQIAIPAGLGAFIGYVCGDSIRAYDTLGGFSAIGAGVVTIVLISLIGGCLAVVIIASSTARRDVFVGAAALGGGLVLGAFVGAAPYATSAAPEVPPAPSFATGPLTVRLAEPAGLEWAGPAVCHEGPDGLTVDSIVADQVSVADGGPITVRIIFREADPQWLEVSWTAKVGTASATYEAGPCAGGSCAGEATLSLESGATNRTSGRLRFSRLALTEGSPLPLTSPPVSLAGTVDWVCPAG